MLVSFRIKTSKGAARKTEQSEQKACTVYLDILAPINQIQENVFMQYFLGYSSFTNETPFDPSLFVDIRRRLSLDVMNSINEIVIAHHFDNTDDAIPSTAPEDNEEEPGQPSSAPTSADVIAVCVELEQKQVTTHKGRLLMDATVAP